LRPGARRGTAGAVVAGSLADSPWESDGTLLRGTGYVERHVVDAFPQCLSFTFLPSTDVCPQADGGERRCWHSVAGLW